MFKRTVYSIGIFLISAVIAGYSDSKYQQFVGALYKIFQGEKLVFFGKYQLFPTWTFVISFAISSVIIFNLVLRLKARKKAASIVISAIALLITLMISSYVASTILIAECTICQNGIRTVNYSSIDYDTHAIISLVMAIIASIIYSSHQRRKINN